MARKTHEKTIAPIQANPTGGMRLVPAGSSPNVEMKIRQRAYELYSARGGESGHDLEDWLRAETEIIHS